MMPVGFVSESGGERMVGVPSGGDTDALVDWTVGATGSGKTWHALSRVVALAEVGRGFLYLDPHRTAVWDIKRFLAGDHGDRILEIDLQATNAFGMPMSAGWNPLDLTVVAAELRKSRVDNLRAMLPGALFPAYFTGDGKSPQTATILRKSLECLLYLNLGLPPQIQASIFCIENLLLDPDWRDLAVTQLPVRDRKWWYHTFPLIVGRKGALSAALKPALNALEQWKSQQRVQALLGASQTTLRWREIIDGGKILLVVLNNDRSETDSLLARLLVGEMINAFKERGLTHQQGNPIRPFHLILDEFQSYATVLETHAGVMVQELRKFGAKVHFINQSPSAIRPRLRDTILSNRTHLFSGRLGSPADAEIIVKAMGTQPAPHQQNGHRSPRLEAGDLLGLAKWHFIGQVTLDGKLSAPFQIRGINADQAWAHLVSDRDITDQITQNTGLEPVDKRLDHYDTLPERIAHWHRTQQLLTTQQALQQPPGSRRCLPATAGSTPLSPGRIRRYGPTAPDHRQRTVETEQTRIFNSWATDCLVEDPDASTSTRLLADSYTRNTASHNKAHPSPPGPSNKTLTRRYGPSHLRVLNRPHRRESHPDTTRYQTKRPVTVTRNTPTRSPEPQTPTRESL